MEQTDAVLDRTLTDDVLQPWISLLVLQPSPFCNIDCDYCYLPNRALKKRMPLEVVAATIEKVFAADLVFDPLTIIWHAGEPLAVPISYYEEAFEEIRRKAPAGVEIRHCMQSNATLINAIGLSIDGPAHIHDAHRKTRSGRGSHEMAMRGLRLLQARGIPFHVISVITKQSLGHAEDIYHFFDELGISQLGFNIEEIEGKNAASSLSSSEVTPESFKTLWLRSFDFKKRMVAGCALGSSMRRSKKFKAKSLCAASIFLISTNRSDPLASSMWTVTETILAIRRSFLE